MSGDRFNAEHVTEVVARLAALIQKDRESTPSEAQTVAKYVLPLLRALGWSLEDDRVIMEYPVRGTAVDLALVTGPKALALVEAKRLRQNLSLKDDEAAQALKYGYESGTNWCVLTNGERYEVYDAFRRVDHARKLVTSFTITGAAADPSTALPSLRLLSYEAVTGGELGRYAKASFAAERVREALGEPAPSVIGALVGELEGCGLTEDDVRLGLGLVVGEPPADGPCSRPAAEPLGEGETTGKGAQTFAPPIRPCRDGLSVAKHRTRTGGEARCYVSLDALKLVVARAVGSDAKGQEFDVGSIWRSGEGLKWDQVLRGLGILWVAGLLRHTRGVMPAYYRLKTPMAADDIVARVLALTTPDDSATAGPSSLSAKQGFRWAEAIAPDGQFTMECRYLADETKSFVVRGTRVAPDADFKPARAALHKEILQHIAPLFPGVAPNLVSSKAWSGVHKVYPSKAYGS